MPYVRRNTHHSTQFSHRAIVSLALCVLVTIGALLALAGDTGTLASTAVTQSPSAVPSALTEAREPLDLAVHAAPVKPQQTTVQLSSTSLVPTPVPVSSATTETTPEPPQVPQVRAGLTTDDYVNLRAGPATSYPILSQLPADAPAQVLGEQGGWYQIVTPWDASGWVVAGLFRLTPEPATPAHPQRLGTAGTLGRVNLREGPGTGYPSTDKLRDGAVLEVLALEGEWYNVRTARGIVGWVSAEYVALDWIPDIYGGSGVTADASSSDVVRIAEEYLGTRYVWGGSDPTGFDCSGLIWHIYRQVGVRLPAGSVQQFDTVYGRLVRTMDALAPGDLVFFERTSDESWITHVGVYAGGGKMIAARSERLGVRYVSLLEPFWNSRFVGGIRPYR